MAFQSAASGSALTGGINNSGAWNNLTSGNFSPVIYSKKVQKALRASSVIEAVTNTDYTGEIANMGDSVNIIKEPDITVSAYARGTALATQALTDAAFTMVVNKANYYQFAMDDIEEAHSHVNFIDLATDRAGYKMKDAMDAEVLRHMAGYTDATTARTALETGSTKADANADNDELLAANKLRGNAFSGVSGDSTKAIPIAADGGTGIITSPLEIMNRIARMMDQANVDTDGRYIVVDPVFCEVLLDTSSKLINSDFGGGDELRNGKLPNKIRGFDVYKSNNLPYKGTGPGTATAAGSTAHYGVLVAGHMGAVATAQQISKTETFRSPDTFADIVRGMNLYARKILRSDSLFNAWYNLA
jgi:hypothetical protein